MCPLPWSVYAFFDIYMLYVLFFSCPCYLRCDYSVIRLWDTPYHPTIRNVILFSEIYDIHDFFCPKDSPPPLAYSAYFFSFILEDYKRGILFKEGICSPDVHNSMRNGFTWRSGVNGCGMGPLLVLVSPCFRENVVVTCKIGSFLCSLVTLLQKNVIVFCFGNQISKWRSFEKRAIFDLLFTFLSHQEKVTKIPSAHISLTYIHVFCSLY